MKATRFYTPYLSDGKTRFSGTQGKTGVYIIRENEKIVYIGYSSRNLYKTMYRHFQAWNHSTQEVVTYAGKLKKHRYTIRVVTCEKSTAMKLERALIIKYKPRDNDVKYDSYTMKKSDIAAIDNYESTLKQSLEEAPF
jgi:excinuclease UvrABC nuclease subunit